jgi:hypothetical protein
MVKLVLGLFFWSMGFAQTTGGEAKINFVELEKMMLTNCMGFSTKEKCEEKASQIRNGMTNEQLLGKAQVLAIDNAIKVTLIRTPEQMIENYYCLPVFNGLIPATYFEPDLFAFAVRGLSFSAKSVTAYSRWLKGAESANCRGTLKALKLETREIQNPSGYQIVLNPISFLEFGAEEGFESTALTTYNHKRL